MYIVWVVNLRATIVPSWYIFNFVPGFVTLLDSLLKRSKSAFSLLGSRRSKGNKKRSPLTTMEQRLDPNLDLSASLDGTKSGHTAAGGLNTSSIKSSLSYEDARFSSSPGSSLYNMSTDFEIPNSADYLPSPGAFSFR